MEFCLVQMPYASVARPSMGLSILKACLAREGIESRIFYSNFQWAETIGLDVYGMIENSPTAELFGEWTFSGNAFPDFKPNHRLFLQSLATQVFGSDLGKWIGLCHPHLQFDELAWWVREQVDGFIASMVDEILSHNPRIVGCSSMFQQQCASLALLRRIKQSAPEVTTMMGGANCEGIMGRASHLLFPWIDFVVSGEVETFIGPLVRSILDGSPASTSENPPTGVWAPWHRNTGKPLSEVQEESNFFDAGETLVADRYRGILKDMNHSPTPEFDDYFDRLRHSRLAPFINPVLVMENSRGCWWGAKKHCTFCGLNGNSMAFRQKSPQRVLSELVFLCRRHALNRVEFVDNILDMKYLDTVLPEIGTMSEPYHLFFEIKPNLKKEHVATMSRAGVRWVQPGIESLHKEILDRLDKGVSPLQNVQLLKWGHQFGIHIYYSLLSGLPGDDDRWYEETALWLPLIYHLHPPLTCSRIRIDRFSPYHRDFRKYDLNLSPKHNYSFVYPFSKTALNGLAYYFEDYTQLDRGVANPVKGPAKPGLKALQDSVNTWRGLWMKPERPSLTMTDEGHRLVLRDTRPVSWSAEIILEGIQHVVLVQCDRPRSQKYLNRIMKGSATEKEIATALASLEQKKVLLFLDGKYLNLAVPHQQVPYPAPQNAPLGLIDYRGYYRTIGRDTSPGESKLRPKGHPSG